MVRESDKKEVLASSNFYRAKGFNRTVQLYMRDETYEKLRALAYENHESLQITLRTIVEERLAKVKT